MMGMDVEDDGSLSLTIIWNTDKASKVVRAANVHNNIAQLLGIRNVRAIIFLYHHFHSF